MNQTALFHDSILDALGADIAALGGYKKVAAQLWPALTTDGATRLRNALNPEHAQKLCPLEVLKIKQLAVDAGSYATMNYEALLMGYRYVFLDPKDEAEDLRREIRDSLAALTRKMERLERAEFRAHKSE